MRGHTVLILLLIFSRVMAQEEKENFKPQLRGAIMMANSHIPSATSNGKEVAIVPTWGVDVDYVFHPRWQAAFQSDVELQSFEVEDGETLVDRSYPVALALVIQYEVMKRWSFYAGPGYELEKSRNLGLVRLGTEYSFEISEKFEIALNLCYEDKFDVYNTWTFGVVFNKMLWKKE